MKFQGSIETTCDPVRIEDEHERSCFVAYAALPWCYMSPFVGGYAYLFTNGQVALIWLAGFTAFVIFCVLFIHFISRSRVNAARKARARIARLFSRFSHIETLVLENFCRNEHVLQAARVTLAGVRIDRLEIIGDVNYVFM